MIRGIVILPKLDAFFFFKCLYSHVEVRVVDIVNVTESLLRAVRAREDPQGAKDIASWP